MSKEVLLNEIIEDNSTTNLSKIKRDRLLGVIEELKESLKGDVSKITALNEIASELTKKKYGLLWEEHEEEVDRQLITKLPIFKEDKDREIKLGEKGKNVNFLLEGDNLHSLKLLEKTHRSKIDVIYIDPPYNTGKKDFKYGDRMVDELDDFRHSKWVSFMAKRLEVARELLTEEGVIFISIDDRELYPLKMLCDGIFGENNFIANMIRQNKAGSGHDSKFLAVEYDYCLVYAKNKNSLIFNELKVDVDDKKYKYEDDYVDYRGKYYLRDLQYKSSKGSPSSWTIKLPNGEEVYSDFGNKRGHEWRWGKEKVKWGIENEFIVFKNVKGVWKIYIKQYQYVDNNNNLRERTIPFSALVKFLNTEGTKEIRNIPLNQVFSYPKPLNFLMHILTMHPNKNAIILDFFAGSGTTGQAVLELNKEDGGNRTFILCTNNEVGEDKEKEFAKLYGNKEDNPKEWEEWEEQYGICRSITYQRMKKVIEGYTTPKGKEIEGIPANLKYYKTDYVAKENLDDDDYDINEEILKYIVELIQLEYGVDISNKEIGLILSDLDGEETEEYNVRKITLERLSEIKTMYIAEDLIIPYAIEDEIEKRNIKVKRIPKYYSFN